VLRSGWRAALQIARTTHNRPAALGQNEKKSSERDRKYVSDQANHRRFIFELASARSTPHQSHSCLDKPCLHPTQGLCCVTEIMLSTQNSGLS